MLSSKQPVDPTGVFWRRAVCYFLEFEVSDYLFSCVNVVK